MMHQEIVFAGFGGQGVLFAGQILAHAGMMHGKQVAWVPSYGPEMRGGTAFAAVIISDEEIGSLVVAEPTAAVVMNAPSFDRYEGAVRPGGLLVVNRSLVERPAARTDLKVLEVPASAMAGELGNARLANVVLLGALVAATGVVPPNLVLAALGKSLAGPKAGLLAENERAFSWGMRLVEARSLSLNA